MPHISRLLRRPMPFTAAASIPPIAHHGIAQPCPVSPRSPGAPAAGLSTVALRPPIRPRRRLPSLWLCSAFKLLVFWPILASWSFSPGPHADLPSPALAKKVRHLHDPTRARCPSRLARPCADLPQAAPRDRPLRVRVGSPGETPKAQLRARHLLAARDRALLRPVLGSGRRPQARACH